MVHISEPVRSERSYRALFEANPLPTWVFDRETLRFMAVNDAAVASYGYSRDEFLGMTIADIRPPEEVAALRDHVQSLSSLSEMGTWRHRKQDGTLIDVEVTGHDFQFGGRPARLVVVHDVTERNRAEQALRRMDEQLRQAHKMEAVGRLAGGIAHDFNNILTAVLTYSNFALGALRPGDPVRQDVAEIEMAGQRAAALTRQLLAFSRRQVIEPAILDLNAVIADTRNMLARIIGEDIDLLTAPAPGLSRVRADRGQIEQILLNLVVNARDAMPRGGKVFIETCNTVLDEGYAAEHVGVVAGRHVTLTVTDTGCGIDRVTMPHIFEPFFTTKEAGKGTGLGLSTVYGIVQQSGGSIWVYSEPGHGTTFKVHLPAIDESAGAPASVISGPAPARVKAVILLAEDDDNVLRAASRALTAAGHEVLEAGSAQEACAIAALHRGPIDLLLSDMVMPRGSGPELAAELTRQRPELKVLFMSGFTDHAVVQSGMLRPGQDFIEKPFTPDGLLTRVQKLLAGTPAR